MRIAIIGPGAMGCLFYVQLARSGADVILLAQSPESAKELSARPIRLWEGEELFVAEPRVLPPPFDEKQFDLVIVAVKAHATKNAALFLRSAVGPSTLVLTLQNGLGPQSMLLEEFGPSRVLAGTTAQGATLLGPGEVRHGGNGDTFIGPAAQGGPDGGQAAAALCSAGFKTTAVSDIYPYIWRKLAVNCAINPLTALLGARNGELPENQSAARIMEQVAGEVSAVAAKKGIDIGEKSLIYRQILKIAADTGQNRSSMLQDVSAGRKTEIEYLNRAVACEGEALGLPCPANAMLANLISALERVKRS